MHQNVFLTAGFYLDLLVSLKHSQGPNWIGGGPQEKKKWDKEMNEGMGGGGQESSTIAKSYPEQWLHMSDSRNAENDDRNKKYNNLWSWVVDIWQLVFSFWYFFIFSFYNFTRSNQKKWEFKLKMLQERSASTRHLEIRVVPLLE